MSSTQIFLNVLTLLTTIANIVIAVCACIGLFSWKDKLNYDKATLKRKKAEELNLILVEFDSVFDRLNPSYTEIPDLLAKIDELQVYINVDLEMGKALEEFYMSYKFLYYFTHLIHVNHMNQTQEILDIIEKQIGKIPAITNRLKNLITKELK